MPCAGRLLRALAAATAAAAMTALVAAPVHATASGRHAPLSRSAARLAPGETPLSLTIDQLAPATIPEHGPLRISGTVTNEDVQTWTDVHIYPFISKDPMTTPAELAQAAVADPTAVVGSRITSERADVGDLQPGQSEHYTITIPRDELAYNEGDSEASDPITEPGVYWFGVHALGGNDDGRDNNADGRARTFLPLIATRPSASPAKVSILLQLRRSVVLQPDGSVADVGAWTQDLTTGRLARLVSFGAGNPGLTWVVDPAVLDAVRRLSLGNPPRDLSPDQPASTSSPSPSGSASGSPATGGPSPSPSGDVDPVTAAARTAALAWLAAFKQATTGHDVLALPYGDPDISAVAADLPTLYQTARDQSDAVMKSLGITAEPAVAPLSGYLSTAGLRLVGKQPETLLSTQAITGLGGGTADLRGHLIRLLSTTATTGGPLPGDPLAPLSLRQRIVAEASLRYGMPNRPLVVALPADWTPPRSSTPFLSAFKPSWSAFGSYSSTQAGVEPTPITAAQVVFPLSEAQAQVSATTLSNVRGLMEVGSVLDDVLPDHHGLATQVTQEALTSASYFSRGGDGEPAAAAQADIEALLGGVHIVPPTAVTLSSASGRFSVTVANDMSQTVSVRMRAVSDKGIVVRGPDSLTIAAGDTASVLLSADAHTNGVHQITLELVDSQGTAFGQAVRFPVRASQVSGTIWLFVGVGVGLLFLAIAVRLVRRLTRRRVEVS